ncbi:hypothetical protein KC19_4G088100 [Ceratodon purpureus]|uniref:Helicase C-terminal domain-containing protein n=1 Tax=Ceratodon purpureus TaxID=3225 RepID=A0A8T0I9Y1_CERPU|nr:hypothetical protein KC19_4G088100 [Ceratodon purpureus]
MVHVKKLISIDMEVINGSGAPADEKHVFCWLPPETKNGDRRSVYKETVKIVVALMKADLKMLVFVEARKSSEIVCKMIRDKLTKLGRMDLVEKVDSYRAGYTQEERISLEKRLQDGQLQALVTTRALELGIDVRYNFCSIHSFEGEGLYHCRAEVVREVAQLLSSLLHLLGHDRCLKGNKLYCTLRYLLIRYRAFP